MRHGVTPPTTRLDALHARRLGLGRRCLLGHLWRRRGLGFRNLLDFFGSSLPARVENVRFAQRRSSSKTSSTTRPMHSPNPPTLDSPPAYSAAAVCSSIQPRMCFRFRRSMDDDVRMSVFISMNTAPTPTAQEIKR